MTHIYTFRPVVAGDLPMLKKWLNTPEVIKWWGEPGVQLALIEADIDDDRLTMQIVSCNGTPFAYIQHYDIGSSPQGYFKKLPPGSRAIDTFIGVLGFLGKGHGSKYLTQLKEQLHRDGTPAIAIDPDSTNMRARKAYENAGFSFIVEIETGTETIALMISEMD